MIEIRQIIEKNKGIVKQLTLPLDGVNTPVTFEKSGQGKSLTNIAKIEIKDKSGETDSKKEMLFAELFAKTFTFIEIVESTIPDLDATTNTQPIE